MGHTLIVGITESGKTTLAKLLCDNARKSGIGTLVLDPMHDTWNAEFQTDDEREFLEVFWQSRNCDVYIDEAGDMIGQYDKTMIQTATKGRHWGHNVHFLTQRGAMISPTVREMCRTLILFVSSRAACKVLAEEYNEPRILEASGFEVGEYFVKPRHGDLEHRHLFKEI